MNESQTAAKGPLAGFFRGRAVVVTGASSGIGYDVARAFAKQGAKVALLARRKVHLDKLAGKIAAAGGTALALECDVVDRSRVFRAIEQARDAFGGLDILINSAGLLIPNTFEEMAPVDLERMMAVNLYGAVHAMQAAIPIMRAAGHGNIVNIASLAGRRGVSPLGGYSATKFALVGLTDAIRIELFGTGIRVSLVMPGVIDTPMTRDALKHEPAKGVSALFSMPVRWVTYATLAAAAFGLTEVGVPPGAAVVEKLTALFPSVTDAFLSVGTRIAQASGLMPEGSKPRESRK